MEDENAPDLCTVVDAGPISEAAKQLAGQIKNEIDAQFQAKYAGRYEHVFETFNVVLTVKQRQHTGALLVLMREKRFALNSLPCGAGKTFITLAAIAADYTLDNFKPKVAVLVLPRGLMAQWKDAMGEILGRNSVHIVEICKSDIDEHGSVKRNTTTGAFLYGPPPKDLTFVLVSTAAVCTENMHVVHALKKLKAVPGTIVVDECHMNFRKNERTAVKALRMLNYHLSTYAMVLLSATPVCNLANESSNTLGHAYGLRFGDSDVATLTKGLTDQDCSAVLRALSVQDSCVERDHANSFTFFVGTRSTRFKTLRAEQHGNGIFPLLERHERYKVAAGFLLHACKAGWSVGFAADNKTGLREFADFLQTYLPAVGATNARVFVLTSETTAEEEIAMLAAIANGEQVVILMTTSICTGRNFQCLRMIVSGAVLPILEFMEQIWGRMARKKQEQTTIFLVLVNKNKDRKMLEGLVTKRERSREYYQRDPTDLVPSLDNLQPCLAHQTEKVFKHLQHIADTAQHWGGVEEAGAGKNPRVVPWRIFTHIKSEAPADASATLDAAAVPPA